MHKNKRGRKQLHRAQNTVPFLYLLQTSAHEFNFHCTKLGGFSAAFSSAANKNKDGPLHAI
jgi:hypothetical protein